MAAAGWDLGRATFVHRSISYEARRMTLQVSQRHLVDASRISFNGKEFIFAFHVELFLLLFMR